ncbi:MAG: enoyl-CoA hydratase/isomerase family protein [Chloroflexota bacterium]
MEALTVRADGEIVAACERWLEAVPYPTAVLVLAIEHCRDASAARAVGKLPMPVLGHASGAVRDQALELWLACDVRMADPAATFGVSPEYIPTAGLTYRLPKAVGRSAALDLLLVRDQIDATEALRLGLATRQGREAAAEQFLIGMLELPPVAARFAKEAILRGESLSLEQGLQLETDLYALLQTTTDRAEGLAAWREKRPPQFHGD